MNLRISDFCHFVEGIDGLTALYNSLTLGVVIVDKDTADFFRQVKAEQHKIIFSNQVSFLDDNLVNQLIKHKLVFSLDQRLDIEEYRKIQVGLKDKKIGLLYLLMIDTCNLACTYCFIRDGMPRDYKSSKMSIETARFGIDLFVNSLKNNTIEKPQIIFYGGEPLINFSVIESALLYVEDLKDKEVLPQGTSVTINTNGTLVNEKIVSVLKKVKNLNVAISLDGPKEIHNQCRKYRNSSGTFDDVMRGYRLLSENGINVGVCCTISKYNVDQLQEISKWFVNELGVTSVSFNILIETNEIESVRDDIWEYSEKTAKQIINCYRFFREKGVYEDRIMRKVNAFVDGYIYYNDCGGCGEQIVVTPDGMIGPCQAYCGNKKYFIQPDKSFDPLTHPIWEEWRFRSPLFMEQCRNCIALSICGGGCPYSADKRNGSIWELDDAFCIHAKATTEFLIKDLIEKMASMTKRFSSPKK